MKAILVLTCLLFVGQAFATAYENAYLCEDGGLLEIGVRNNEGYAPASLSFEDNRSSDLAAIWFTSNPKSLIGTMLSDDASGLGPVVLSKNLSSLIRGHEKVKCSLANYIYQ